MTPANRLLVALSLALLLVSLVGCGRSRHASTTDGGGVDGGPAVDGGASVDGGGDTTYGYCEGATPTELDCRADSECDCGSCVTGFGCGAVGCASLCASDTDCDADSICTGGCCSSCIPKCPVTACTAGTVCNETTGHCDPIHCGADGGVPCRQNYRCTEGAPGTGCVQLGCTTDAECDCGTCVGGLCFDRPGQCCPPLPG